MTRRVQQQLDKLYASLPTMKCRGLCQTCCGSVVMTAPERDRIATRHGIRLPLAGVFLNGCPALVDGRCSVYADRPLICRTWGMVPSLRCPHGCEPDGGMMSERDGARAAAQAFEIAGDKKEARRLRAMGDQLAAGETE